MQSNCLTARRIDAGVLKEIVSLNNNLSSTTGSVRLTGPDQPGLLMKLTEMLA